MREMIKRGEIWLVNLNPTLGHEINKIRPAVIIQNDDGNEHSPLTIIAPITSNIENIYPFNVFLEKGNGLEKDSKVLLNQIRTIDKKRLMKRLGKVNAETQLQIDEAMRISLGLAKVDHNTT